MTLYRVRDGISHVAGKPVPETRLVELTDAEALYDLSLDRIEIASPVVVEPEKPARRSARPAGDIPDGGN